MLNETSPLDDFNSKGSEGQIFHDRGTIDPRLNERQTVRIQHLPSALQPFVQQCGIVCICFEWQIFFYVSVRCF